jgi:hypothetical protein
LPGEANQNERAKKGSGFREEVTLLLFEILLKVLKNI